MNEAERLELLQHFREEAAEHSEAVSRALLALEGSPGNESLQGEILRRAHSLKGAARVIGMTAVEGVAAAFETVMAEVKAGRLPLDRRVMDPLLAALDAVKSWGDSAAGDSGLEEIAHRLMSLASLTLGLEESLSRLLPGLDPETREVLTEYQKSRLISARDGGKSCWEVLLSVAPVEFSARADAARAGLRNIGELVGFSGLAPLSDGTLRFKFLIVTRLAPEAVREAAAGLALEFADPAVQRAEPPAGDGRQVSAEDAAAEAAFEKEVAGLFQQYVSIESEKVDDLPRLIVSAEGNPEDQELVNELFRAAHNLKGSGATFGLDAVSGLAHQMETVIAAVRDGKFKMTSRAANALLKAADVLKKLFAEVRAGKPPGALPPAVLRDLETAFQPEYAPEAPKIAAAAAASPPRETIRVNLGKLDRLANLADELTISRNTRNTAVKEIESLAEDSKNALRRWRMLRDSLRSSGSLGGGLLEKYDAAGAGLAALKDGLDDIWNRFSSTTLHSESVAGAIQEDVMRIRMVPVATLFDTAPRLIRDLTSDREKSVTLRISGSDTEVDRRVLEMMSDPLLHLLRNAVDHGIEPSSDRLKAGKPPAGTIELFAGHRGSHVVVEVRDDGGGLDPARLAAKAVEKKLISPEEAAHLTPERAYSFIFHPGFSTREQVTSISGRGVGMDVVKSNIDALKGRIEIESSVGRGTTFRLYLPLSISVIQAVLVDAAGRNFCFQAGDVSAIVGVGEEDIRSEDGKACIFHRGATLPLVRLSDLLALKGGPRREGRFTVLVVSGGAGAMGLAVDRAIREETVVLKDIKPPFRRAPFVAGGTILADGKLSVILDTAGLVAAAVDSGPAWAGEQRQAKPAAKRRVLVVDDSLTTRQLLRSLLEGAGYITELASDGAEAWELLGRKNFDIVVSDVSMPGLDGYELTSRIKSDPRFSGLPVVLVTSLEKEEERLRGLRAGADAYIVKGAFDQNGLLARIKELAG
ncbi:MAG: hybrid sensor histidine kinase/response regulator [Elusimicrobiales bacterium]|nr:hybrid sensor histidine kinase/response regulator [Elusimicrobiales bacterium]